MQYLKHRWECYIKMNRREIVFMDVHNVQVSGSSGMLYGDSDEPW
jgi:hypothetical protein